MAEQQPPFEEVTVESSTPIAETLDATTSKQPALDPTPKVWSCNSLGTFNVPFNVMIFLSMKYKCLYSATYYTFYILFTLFAFHLHIFQIDKTTFLKE